MSFEMTSLGCVCERSDGAHELRLQSQWLPPTSEFSSPLIQNDKYLTYYNNDNESWYRYLNC